MTGARDFWSRRRAAVEAEAAERMPADDTAPPDTRTDAEILQELNLPDPDTLDADGDIRAFMDHLVPDHLRRRALRRFWRLNPTLANLDGLVDYGEDYTDSATVIDSLQTVYRVGKGMLDDAELPAVETDDSAPADLPDPETGPDPEVKVGLAEAAPEAATAADTGKEAVPAGDPDAPVAPPAPRRMRFAFHGGATRQRT